MRIRIRELPFRRSGRERHGPAGASPRARGRGLFVIGVLVGALTGAQPLAPAQEASVAEPPRESLVCKPWVIISAYGADTEVTPEQPYGSAVNDAYLGALTKALHEQGIGTGGRDAAGHPVDDDAIDLRNASYPAEGPGLPWQKGYSGSLEEGKQTLAQDVAWYDQNCGGRSNVILLGYSEGAHLVKETMQLPQLQQHQGVVNAVLGVADPSRTNTQRGMADGGQMETVDKDFRKVGSDPSAGGVMARLTVPEVFSGTGGHPGGRYFDICRADDAFCNSPEPRGQGNLSGGTWALIRSLWFDDSHHAYERGAEL